MSKKEEEYLEKQRALGYEPSLRGMDEDDFDYVPSWVQGRRPEEALFPKIRPGVDRDFAERIFRMFGRPHDPNWRMPNLDNDPCFTKNPPENTSSLYGRDMDGETVKKSSRKDRPKHGMGSADATDNQGEGRYSVFYSKDDQLVHLVDNQDGSLVKSWECRSNFVPGVNEQGQPRESLPTGTYTVTAEVNKDGFKDRDGRSDPAYGTFYITTGDPRGRDFHGGGSGLPNPYAPRQGWVDTYGCPRMQNEDGEDLSRYIMKQGQAKLHVVRGPVRFGPYKLPGEEEQAPKNDDRLIPSLTGFTYPGPY